MSAVASPNSPLTLETIRQMKTPELEDLHGKKRQQKFELWREINAGDQIDPEAPPIDEREVEKRRRERLSSHRQLQLEVNAIEAELETRRRAEMIS